VTVTRQRPFEKEIRKRLRETGNVNPKALENAGPLRAVFTPDY
jgi:hypothetical protein